MKNNKKFILSIDLGSTSIKVGLINDKAEIIEFLSKKVEIFNLKEGFLEHDPITIYEDLLELLNKICLKIDYTKISCIAITNQRESVVVWNKDTGIPIYPMISWQDWRSKEKANKYSWSENKKVRDKTGLIINSYFSALKINWILKNIKHKNNILCGTLDSWILWKLTNKKSFFTDITNASRTLLCNIKTLKWDKYLLNLFSINKNILPEIKNSLDFFGNWEYKNFKIPIYVVMGDQQSALFSCGKINDFAICTMGTGAFLLFNTGEKLFNKTGFFGTVACKTKNKPTTYALEASIFNCGNVINWAQNMGLIDSLEIEQHYELKKNLYFVPNLNKNDDFISQWIGFNFSTTKKEIFASILRGLAFNIGSVILKLQKKIDFRKIIVNGKLSENNFLLQELSNTINLEIITFKSKEMTLLGVAYLAGIYLNFWNEENIFNLNKILKKFYPTIPVEHQQKNIKLWKKIIKNNKFFI